MYVSDNARDRASLSEAVYVVEGVSTDTMDSSTTSSSSSEEGDEVRWQQDSIYDFALSLSLPNSLEAKRERYEKPVMVG
jgi:hypothetical protein